MSLIIFHCYFISLFFTQAKSFSTSFSSVDNILSTGAKLACKNTSNKAVFVWLFLCLWMKVKTTLDTMTMSQRDANQRGENWNITQHLHSSASRQTRGPSQAGPVRDFQYRSDWTGAIRNESYSSSHTSVNNKLKPGLRLRANLRNTSPQTERDLALSYMEGSRYLTSRLDLLNISI